MLQQQEKELLTTFVLGDLKFPNRIVMTSLTRGRATNPEMAPTELHVKYYAQRASAGLILTESVWVSTNAIGFLNIPGIFTRQQIDAWKKVTNAVHDNGGRIFMQLSHIGAASHPDYHNGDLPLGPSAINPEEKSFTKEGFKDTVTPRSYSIEEIRETIEEYRRAAINAKEAGFDGIELHAQLFTLIPQFLSTATNQRIDEYGGSIENRCRMLFEILEVLISVFPNKKVAVKFTPAAFNPGVIKPNENTIPTFDYIFQKLNHYDIAFIELVGPSVDLEGTSIAALQDDFYEHFRAIYKGVIVANLGFNWETANAIIASGNADMVSFGTPFIANPDLVERFRNSEPLAIADIATYYSGEEKGYVDYSNAKHEL